MPEVPSERAMSSASMGRGVSPFAALERCRLFEGLAHGDRMSVAMAMRPRRFEQGETLCRAGESGDRLYVIVDGLVAVVPAGVGGAEQSAIAKYRRGEVVGATALVTREPHAATVVAAVATEVLELERREFEPLLERFPAILVNFSRILSRRLWRSYAQVADERERGEAVGLVFSRSLAAAVPRVLESTEAASPRAVASLDTRRGYHDAVAGLDDLLEDHGTVLVTARAEGRSAPLLLDQVDRVALLVDGEQDASRFQEAAADARGRVEVVLVEDGPATGRGRRRRSIASLPVSRVAARQPGDCPLPPDEIAWLGRHLARTKLGLALGAGGAKGFAHVGALQVLEQAGYRVDSVAGSSIGALVGCYVALGMDAAAIDRTLREAFNPETVAEIFQLSLAGGSAGLEAITRLFRETTGEKGFDELGIPMVAMSVDLNARRPAPISEGPLWEALLAATALAGMFPPYERGGERLVDGLALVPVPTGAAYEAGADVVMSVNLMPRETLAAWPGQEPPPPEPPRKRGSRLLETILEVMDLSQLEESVRHAELADVVLHPRFGPASWRDFHLADLFLEAGRDAAAERLPDLSELVRPQFAGAMT